MNLLSEWANWRVPDQPPMLFEADRPYFEVPKLRSAIVTDSDWATVFRASDFGQPGDRRIHLGLIPQPFAGDLKRASIYVLLLNPGLGAWDYYAESMVPEFHHALLDNLKQKHRTFFLLDPRFGWYGGFHWWNSKLAKVIDVLAERWGVSFAKARQRLSRELASIELFPYHSASFYDAGRWLGRLPSVELARTFVTEHVLSRVHAGEAIAIVTRQVDLWKLPEHSNIVRFSRVQARAAHMSPGSPGGDAIIKHMLNRFG